MKGMSFVDHYKALARSMTVWNRTLEARIARSHRRDSLREHLFPTLLHILITDTIWLQRFKGNDPPLSVTTPSQECCEATYREFLRQRLECDEEIQMFIHACIASDMLKSIIYHDALGCRREDPLGICF